MRVRIDEISCSDVDDLARWAPRDSAEIYLPIALVLGREGSTAGALFSIFVASPEALRARSQPFAQPHLLLVREYDWDAIRAELVGRVRACEAGTWAQTLSNLRRSFAWEYEGYGPGNVEYRT